MAESGSWDTGSLRVPCGTEQEPEVGLMFCWLLATQLGILHFVVGTQEQRRVASGQALELNMNSNSSSVVSDKSHTSERLRFIFFPRGNNIYY